MMKQCIPIFCLLSLLAIPPAFSEIPTYSNEPSSEFFQTWLLCGPFPNPIEAYDKKDHERSGFYIDFLQAHGGENHPRIEIGQTEQGAGASASWFAYESEDHAVYLDKAITQDPYVVAYAYCEIVADKAKPCLLAFGSNDGARIWLNGELILDLPVQRGLRIDEDIIPIALQPGRNTLLLKVAETENIWGYSCRLLPYDPKIWGDSKQFFHIETQPDGQAKLLFSGSRSLIGSILRKVTLSVSSADQPDQIVWTQLWSGSRETPIGMDSSAYGEYALRLRVTTSEDAEHEFTLPFSMGPRIDYTLFREGKTSYSIVIGEKASDSERWAAQELQHWLYEISGVEFPLHEDAGALTTNEIIVGFNRHSRALLGDDAREPKPSDESFTYTNRGASILIWGGKDRGTMYGVMAFLENELGCRWYTPTVSVIPQKEFYTFHHMRHRESPGLRVRNDFYFEAFEPIWAARNRVNGAMNYREQPGGLECYWAVHTFYPLMPPSDFFDEHPDYYSLIDGKRVHHHAQLCLTNPGVLRIFTERILRVIRENPQYLIYSVSQNDWAGPCQCDACQAIAKREESESGPVLWFVNQIAEAVEKEFPHKLIGTLAYQYTRKPCKTITPRDNVVIRLCSIECCFAHDFLHCPENESFVKDIEGWAAIAPKLYIWDYVVNFSHYIQPYPNFRVLQPNLQFFRDHNAIGVMEQAAYQSRGGEFAELRAYVIAKLLWNPDRDVREIIDDFMFGYYGRSGQYVRDYFDLLHDRVTPDTHIHLGLRPDDPLFSDEFVRQADALFDRAEIVAETETIRRRVEMARLPILYLKCKRSPKEAIRDRTYDRFTEITKREGITHYAESGVSHREAFHNVMEAER
ncbi:MAG: DUF4838 domain-containing protein [Candidatus Omnitrophota bacterium]|jgi:hypothetical protein|nr:MAG: DUF4838 domain-containing protein [Candidatus Omnitrophota bacterium]